MHGGCVATIIDICSSFAILVFEGNNITIKHLRSSHVTLAHIPNHPRRQTQVEVDWCLY